MSQKLSQLSYVQVSHNDRPIEQTNQLMILSHGYGANGDNLADVARFIAPFFPNAVFICPNAPEIAEASETDMRHHKRLQWFSLADRNAEAMTEKVTHAGDILANFIMNCMEKFSTPYDGVVLLGFSQGTCVSLQAGLSLPQKIGGIIGCSGAFLKAAAQRIKNANKSDVILIHGDKDDILPHFYSETAQKDLMHMGQNCEMHIIKNLGHFITPKMMKIIKASLQRIWQTDSLVEIDS